jgi:hypothetical protein
MVQISHPDYRAKEVRAYTQIDRYLGDIVLEKASPEKASPAKT